jgi:hypothetical protein
MEAKGRGGVEVEVEAVDIAKDDAREEKQR